MLIGHEKQIDFFKKIIKEKKIPHAFIFWGEENIGKKLVAKEISMLLNCESLNNKPCKNCKSCIEIRKGIHRDISIIEKEEEIKISEIKNFINSLSYKSNGKGYKIGIIDNAHLMNSEAQNSFLKNLEEPKEKTIFFLITKYPDMLLKTIISRSIKIKFFKVENSKIREYLIKENVDKEKIEDIISITFGKVGEIISLLKDTKKLEAKIIRSKEIENIIKFSIFEKLNYAKKITEEDTLEDFFKEWTFYFRKKILTSMNNENLIDIKNNLNCLLETKFQIDRTKANNKLLIENLLINIK